MVLVGFVRRNDRDDDKDGSTHVDAWFLTLKDPGSIPGTSTILFYSVVKY